MKPGTRQRLAEDLAALSDWGFVERTWARCSLAEPKTGSGTYLAEAMRRLEFYLLGEENRAYNRKEEKP